MSTPELRTVLGLVADVLETLQIPFVVGGSIASAVHGVARATVDVDISVGIRPEHIASFVDRLKAEFYMDREAILDAVSRRESFNLIHLGSMLKVDVFVSPDTPFQRSVMSRRRPQPLDESPAARAFPLQSPEDVILQKLLWYRTGGEVSERQWRDVAGVLRVQAGSLDDDYLASWAEELGIADLLARVRA